MANKHCRKFNNHEDYINALNDGELIRHCISYCKEEKDAHYDNDMFQLECIYNVTDISQPTKILHQPKAINLMEVDGIVLNNIGQYYQFNSTGQHIIRYSLNTLPSIGSSRNHTYELFKTVTNLISFKCNNDITTFSQFIFNNTGITDINITKNITNIQVDSNNGTPFSDCNLNSISVDPDNPVYDSRNNCNAIIETNTNKLIVGCKNTVIPNTVTTINPFAISWSETQPTIVIPNSVTTISRNGLTSAPIQYINIPASLISATTAFYNQNNYEHWFCCTALEYITVDPDNPVYDSRNNCNALILTSENALVMGSKNTVIPNTVTSISAYAFRNPEITSITIPSNITDIYVILGISPFMDCTGLETVIFESSTPPNITTEPFGSLFTLTSNPNLTNIYVPDESVETYKTLFTTKAPDIVNYVKGISTMP